MFPVARIYVLGLCLGLTAAAGSPGESDEPRAGTRITLSPVEPMDGRDAGGLGGIHKVQFAYPSLVFSSKPRPGQSPTELLSAGQRFKYLRGYGVATFGGTDTGGSVLVRLYIYPGYSYRFTCYVGLPQPSGEARAGGDAFGFKVAAKGTSQDGVIKLRRFQARPVSGIGDPPAPVGGTIALSWDVDSQALPGASAIEIHQAHKTDWAFHACSVLRRRG